MKWSLVLVLLGPLHPCSPPRLSLCRSCMLEEAKAGAYHFSSSALILWLLPCTKHKNSFLLKGLFKDQNLSSRFHLVWADYVKKKKKQNTIATSENYFLSTNICIMLWQAWIISRCRTLNFRKKKNKSIQQQQQKPSLSFNWKHLMKVGNIHLQWIWSLLSTFT